MIGAMQALGYHQQLIGQFKTEEQLQQLSQFEESLPKGAPVMITLTFESEPSYDSLYQLEVEISKTGVGKVFDFYVYQETADPRTVHIVYTKGGILSTILIGMLILVGVPLLLGGLIWTFLVPDAVKQIIDVILMMVVMFIMMRVMGAAIKDKPKEPPPTPVPPPPPPTLPPPYPDPYRHYYPYRYQPPPPPQPPVETRIANKIESIADSIARIDAAFRRSDHEGASKVTRAATDIGNVARTVHRAPEAEMPKTEKVKVYDKLSGKQQKLVSQYEERLTPHQRRVLEDERRIVEDLRAMYD